MKMVLNQHYFRWVLGSMVRFKNWQIFTKKGLQPKNSNWRC